MSSLLRSLSCATAAAPSHEENPNNWCSLSTVLLQVSLGHPLFLLTITGIHLRRPFDIHQYPSWECGRYTSTSLCGFGCLRSTIYTPAILLNSSLVIRVGQYIFSTLLRQVRKNTFVWSRPSTIVLLVLGLSSCGGCMLRDSCVSVKYLEVDSAAEANF